jgi:hypothetical protein
VEGRARNFLTPDQDVERVAARLLEGVAQLISGDGKNVLIGQWSVMMMLDMGI